MTPRPRSISLSVPCALALALAACATPTPGIDDGGTTPQTGGASGTGGATGTGAGGTSGGTGGAPATGGATGSGGAPATGGATGSGGAPATTGVVGWAAMNCPIGAVTTTTGGGSAATVAVSTLASLNSNASGTTARVIQVSGTLTGTVTIGSNKTIIGMAGASIHGHVELDRSVNVIFRNLTVVGLNCSDVPSNGDCQDGADAITINNSAHHIWLDHLDVSDGSDGNLDITNQSDCVTVSWTKLHYSASRVAGYTGEVHHFSNLIGGSDTETADTGHLRVTWHHDWWADNVVERQPRVRFGQVHLFNNLWTSRGDNYCIGVGFNANILTENNAFVSVSDPVDSTNYSNSASIVVSRGNLYTGVGGQTANKGTAVFTPGYTYTLDAASSVQAAVMAGVGPK